VRFRSPVLALLAATVLGGCGAWGLGDRGEGQTPEGTVKGYLEASVSGDCRAASRLSTIDRVRQGLWCEDPRVLSYGEIGDPQSRDNEGEVIYVVESVVLGGTGLAQQGLAAGANDIVIQVLQQPDGKWKVNQTTARE